MTFKRRVLAFLSRKPFIIIPLAITLWTMLTQEEEDKPLDALAAYKSVAKPTFAFNGVCGPHCDDLILHAPGECKVCDYYPTLQQLLVDLRVNYTGGRKAGFATSFAERRRPLHCVYAWEGNRTSVTDSECTIG